MTSTRAQNNQDLHGNAPDTSPVVLLLIDVINDMEYPGGERLFEQALPMAERLAGLKGEAKRRGVPAVYVNDNFGKWQSDLAKLVEHCLRDGVRGQPFVERLLPADDDYFVLKPKNSGFYSTTLDLLLTHLGARTLILTGLTGDSCVLFTANDAYMRDYRLAIPDDCVVSIAPDANQQMLEYMRERLKVDLTPSTSLHWDELRADAT